MPAVDWASILKQSPSAVDALMAQPQPAAPMPTSGMALPPPPQATTQTRPGQAPFGPSQSGLGMGGNSGQTPRSPGTSSGSADFVNLPDWARHSMTAASWLAPFPFGSIVGMGSMGLRANNLAATNGLRRSLGLPELNFGQMLGGIFGLNDYGSVDEDAVRGQVNFGSGLTGVSQSGLSRDGLFGFGDMHTTYTPREAQMRAALGLLGSTRGAQRGSGRSSWADALASAGRSERGAAANPGGGIGSDNAVGGPGYGTAR